MADRLASNPKIPEAQCWAYSGLFSPRLVEPRLEEPIRAQKPGRIGVQFMGDLFHEEVPFEVITQIFDVMADARCERHTFLILTKRPERYNRWLNWVCEYWPGDSPLGVTMEVCGHIPNVWFGVSVENQKAADERIPLLLEIPAAVRFVSCEPLLESIDLRQYLQPYHNAAELSRRNGRWGTCVDCPRNKQGKVYPERCKYTKRYDHNLKAGNWLAWIICGAESGPSARLMDEDWVRDIRDQGIDAGIPLFYKQRIENGKKVLMPELDGQVWDQYPKETR